MMFMLFVFVLLVAVLTDRAEKNLIKDDLVANEGKRGIDLVLEQNQ